MRVLFPALSKRRITGARYAEGLMLRALRRRFHVDAVYFEDSPLARMPLPREVSFLFFGYYPYLVRERYDLIITSDSYVYADIVYVQPPAGNSITIPVKDNMLLGNGNMARLAMRLLEHPLDEIMRKHAFFIANSQYTRELIRRCLGRESELLYPPVPVHLYRPKPDGRKNLVVTISSLNPRKNLEVIPDLCEMVPEAHFILIGFYMPQYDYIIREIERRLAEKGLKDKFTYLPSASPLEKNAVLERAKVLFHPTICEPFGISLAEGMAAGAIPIDHNSGGPREFVPEEWRYNSFEEAAEKIREALKSWNLKEAERLSAKAQQFSEEKFEQRCLSIIEKFTCKMRVVTAN